MNNGNYYNEEYASYVENSINVDLLHIYDQFLELIPIKGSILDAGCGSGRDMLYFNNAGYSVKGFDNSIKMVEIASSYSKCSVDYTSFEKIEYKDAFDGIWACASLLHVQREDLNDVFIKLHKALHKGGILYCSFKNREDDFTDNKRSFTCFSPQKIEQFISLLSIFSIEKIFISEDARKERKGEMWTNALLRAL